MALYHYRVADLVFGFHLHILSNYLPSIFLAAVLEAFGYTVHVFLKEHFAGSASARLQRSGKHLSHKVLFSCTLTF